VARIIYVEDGPEWIDIVRHALADHVVDFAMTWDEALVLLRSRDAYDLAIIDWNLEGDDDQTGGEVLDLLREDFPTTRRVVVTGSPPAGDLQLRIYDRYGVQGMIIKDKTRVRDLQLVVRRALNRPAKHIPVRVDLEATKLQGRYREWRDRVLDEIRSHVIEAENAAQYSAPMPRSAEGASAALGRWQALRASLAAECSRLEELIATATTSDDVQAATGQLEEAISRFDAEISRLRQ
jgi:CheY-like chemotaxis protein